MRLYSFVNYYLSPLQHGLQTAHCVSEMYVTPQSGAARSRFNDWAENHKTIIICNGGNAAMLQTLYEQLKTLGDRLYLPVVKFHEDEQSLNTALTSVAIILPEHLYNVEFQRADQANASDASLYDSYVATDADGKYMDTYFDGTDEFALIKLVKSHRLA